MEIPDCVDESNELDLEHTTSISTCGRELVYVTAILVFLSDDCASHLRTSSRVLSMNISPHETMHLFERLGR